MRHTGSKVSRMSHGELKKRNLTWTNRRRCDGEENVARLPDHCASELPGFNKSAASSWWRVPRNAQGVVPLFLDRRISSTGVPRAKGFEAVPAASVIQARRVFASKNPCRRHTCARDPPEGTARYLGRFCRVCLWFRTRFGVFVEKTFQTHKMKKPQKKTATRHHLADETVCGALHLG